jgi:uncharacterized membrane protein
MTYPDAKAMELKAQADVVIPEHDPLVHVRKHEHLNGAFGSDNFGRVAEIVARSLGTPKFIIGQTLVVLVWIALNVLLLIHHWDPYPFILLNLMFSTQAAYASPFILLASTRQADRDKAQSEADARHREEVASRQEAMLQQNTDLTVELRDLVTQDAALTRTVAAQTAQLDEIHRRLTAMAGDLNAD